MRKVILFILYGMLISCEKNNTEKKIEIRKVDESRNKSSYKITDVRIRRIIEDYSKAVGHSCVKCIIVDGAKDEARIILASTFDAHDIEKRYPQGVLYIANDTLLIYSPIDRIFSFEDQNNNVILDALKLKLENVEPNKELKNNYHGTWAINYSKSILEVDKLFPNPFGIPCMNCIDEYRFPIKSD